MPRTLTNNFLAQAASKTGARPFQILEVDWDINGTVTPKFYADRPLSGFVNNTSLPPALETPLVVEWPSVGISLKEGQVGATDQTQVMLDDAAGALTALLSGSDQQRQLVKIWRMFDDPSCHWGTDNGLMLAGVLRPFDWTARDNQITLNLGDLGPLLAKSLSFPASKTIFTHVPTSYQDRQIPLCWGQAQRVEAVCVQIPFETSITAGITAGSGPMTVTIADDPTQYGLSLNTTYNDFTLGTQSVSVSFPDTQTAVISASSTNPLAQAHCDQYVNGSGASQLAIASNHVLIYISQPPWLSPFTLDSYFTPGWPMTVIFQNAQPYSTTLVGLYAHEPFQDNNGIEWYVISLNDPGNYIQNLGPYIEYFQFMNPNPAIQNWPAGTVLKQTGVNTVFIANALPSKNIIRVEGFGTITDSAGTTRKDFIPLGQYVETIISGSSTQTLSGSTITDNTNDNTWNNPPGTLFGQNVTTITFPNGTPRDLFNVPNAQASLDDNRIWITLDGIEDHGDGTGNLISDPALIILQYLENTHLMNVAATSINATSFTNAASALSGYFCGYAQTEAADGLSTLQHIAGLCHSVLFFDQGEAAMAVLSDSAGSIIWTGDTTTHDNMLAGSLTHTEMAIDDIINDLTFKWRAYWDDKTGQNLLDSKNVRLTSVQAFGRMAKEINPCDIFWRREDVAAERDWWLGHLSSIFRYVTFTAFLDALILQPGDWINVTWIDGGGRNLFGGAKAMEVTKCTDTGKDGLVQIEARYVQFTYS